MRFLVYLVLAVTLTGGVVDIVQAGGFGYTAAYAGAAAGSYSENSVTVNSSSTHRSEHDYRKLAPPVAPAPLVSSYSQDVCLGSVTGGVSGGGFGISAGTTTLDHDCVQRRDIRLLHNLGHSDAALAMACQDKEMGAALRSVGKCPAVVESRQPDPISYQFSGDN